MTKSNSIISMRKPHNPIFRKVMFASSIVLALFLNGCAALRVAHQMNETEVHATDYSNGTKTVKFIPMIHVAKPEFYDNVKTAILQAKNEGYVLYYEWIDVEAAPEETKLKLREMVGLLPSPEGYGTVLAPLIEKGYMIQTEEMFLDIVNSKDYNVDITAQEVVNTYEKRFREVTISDENRNLPIHEKYETTHSMKDVKTVILDYRNKYIADYISNSDDEKVILIYGGEHQKGVFENLKSKDANWNEID